MTLDAAGFDRTYTYTYDENGNILSVSDGVNTTSYTYDALNQLTKEVNQAAGMTWEYTYDNGGNITSRKEYDNTTGALVSQVGYTYGDTHWGDLLTAYNGKTITYDGIGNPLNDGTWTYTWENGRQLASMTRTGETWEYSYNADGLRTERSNGTVTYDYIYSGSQLIQMTVGNDTLYFSYDAAGTPMAVTYNGTSYYYATNLQGDIIAILDTSGNAVVEYTYDAWGNILTATNSTLGNLNPLRYRGYVYDTETTLYYLQSRYYDPEMGRFINADSYASTGQGVLGNNMFVYCNNTPVMLCDPQGHCPCGTIGIKSDFAYANHCPVCGSGGGGGAGGAGIAIALEKVSTAILEGAAKIGTWAVAVSTYAYAQTFVNSKVNRFEDHQPMVHHIIPRGKFRRYGPTISQMMDDMHDMLRRAGIDINDPENLIVVSQGSHKSMHTKGYIIQIYNIMKQAQGGGRDAVLEALDCARSYVASLDKYANGW